MTEGEYPLLAQSGPAYRSQQRPLLGVKRTLLELVVMSANDPKRTFPTLDLTTSNLLV